MPRCEPIDPEFPKTIDIINHEKLKNNFVCSRKTKKINRTKVYEYVSIVNMIFDFFPYPQFFKLIHFSNKK